MEDYIDLIIQTLAENRPLKGELKRAFKSLPFRVRMEIWARVSDMQTPVERFRSVLI